jgi:dynein heavy chain
VGTAFKLLDSFEGLLDREIIQTDLEKKQIELMRQYGTDLKEVQEIFAAQKWNPVLSKNAPPHAGAVYWVRGLVARIKVQSLYPKSGTLNLKP